MVKIASAPLLGLVLGTALAGPVRAELACPAASPQLLEIVYTYKTLAPWEPKQRVHRVGAQLCARGELLVAASVPENANIESAAPADEPFPLQLTVARGKASARNLRAFRSVLNEHHISVQQDCYWPEVYLQAQITWFGKGRTNSFVVTSYQASLPICSASVRSIVEEYFRLQEQTAYPDLVVLGP